MVIRLTRAAVAALALSVSVVAPAILSPAAAEAEERVIATGGWAKKSFASAGSWSIVERGGKTVIVLSPEFRTQSAPDLKIFLSPKGAGELNGKNATEGSVLISPLRSNRGAQEYDLPAGVNVSDYATIIIHCEAYSKLWSVGDL